MDFYKDDFRSDILKARLESFAALAHERKICTINDIIAMLKSLSLGPRSLLNEVFRFAKLLLVMPATNAVSEGSFSCLRRIETYLRSTMHQARLNHVMLLHIHRDRTDKLELVDVANDFVKGSEHKLNGFGTFLESDASTSHAKFG